MRAIINLHDFWMPAEAPAYRNHLWHWDWPRESVTVIS
jgi:hypothetical protein